jgi:hypothetical protein
MTPNGPVVSLMWMADDLTIRVEIEPNGDVENVSTEKNILAEPSLTETRAGGQNGVGIAGFHRSA